MKFIDNFKRALSLKDTDRSYNRVPTSEDPKSNSDRPTVNNNNNNNEEYIRPQQGQASSSLTERATRSAGNSSAGNSPKFIQKPTITASPGAEVLRFNTNSSRRSSAAVGEQAEGSRISGGGITQPLDDYYDEDDAMSILSREMTLKDRQEVCLTLF